MAWRIRPHVYSSIASRRAELIAGRSRRLRFEPLETRHLLATITVNTLIDVNNSGDGLTTLREAITAAASNDTINFAAALTSSGPATINLTTAGDNHLTVNKNLTIQGPGANLLTIRAHDPDGNNDSDGNRVFYVNGSGTLNVTISGLTLTNGDPQGDSDSIAGGAIHNRENLTIANCVITGNYSPNGGGVYSRDGALTIVDCTISGNDAQDGAGILLQGQESTISITRSHIIDNNATNAGGGIANRGGNLTVIDSTISGNHGGNPESEISGLGGGLYQYGGDSTITGSTISGNSVGYRGGGIYNANGDMTITNSTISGNSASGDGEGGGIYNNTGDTIVISHSTITANHVDSNGRGGGIRSGDNVQLNHTIVADNIRGASTRDDLSGTFTASFSLIGVNSGASVTNSGSTSLVGTTAVPINALLGSLASNGGLTMTHALLAGSPAIDSGNAAAVAGSGGIPLYDQRGLPFARILDGDGAGGARIDMGAYEKAQAMALVVDIAVDENDGNFAPGDLSLREALAIANANAGLTDTISFHASLSGATINLTLGALSITDAVIITGLGANLLTIDASGNDATPLVNEGNGSRVFNIDDGNAGNRAAVEIVGLRLTGGDVAGDGGAIRSAENLSLRASSLHGNNATGLGGGIQNDQGNLTITDSTLSGNSAGTGGGVWSNTDFGTHATTISNSTISGNSSTTQGGGLFNMDGHAIIRHSTITNNTAPAAAGSGIASNGNAVTMTEVYSSIVAGNANSDVDIVGGVTNSIESIGYNIVGAGNAAGEFDDAGDQAGVSNPALAALANNGGPTMTHALVLGSVAINGGDPAAVAGVGTVPLHDQRGNPNSRVFVGRIDIGAYEFSSLVAPQSLVVDIAGDEHDGNFSAGDLSLREALSIANGNFGVVDSISFQAALSGSTISLILGALQVTDSLAISGLAANLLTIDASGNDPTPLINDGNGSRVFNINNGAVGNSIVAQLSGLTITGGDVAGSGGAINHLLGSLTLAGVTVRDNFATSLGGGLYVEVGNLTISDSTISGNAASNGGGMLVDSTMNIVNSTISGNTATTRGGGMTIGNQVVTIRHSTISDNTAPMGAGSGVASLGVAGAMIAVHSTIIAGNTNSDVDFYDGAINPFQSNGYNLIGSGNAIAEFVETGDQANVMNPMLGALANNGGPTLTHLLLTGSPAINAGDPAASAGVGNVPQFDQRGSAHSRVLGTAIDIGAVEIEAPAGPALPGDYNLDGAVNAADYVVWRRTLGNSVAQYSGADGDGDSMVDDDDYGVWRANFGNTAPGAGSGSSYSSVQRIVDYVPPAAVFEQAITSTNEVSPATAVNTVGSQTDASSGTAVAELKQPSLVKDAPTKSMLQRPVSENGRLNHNIMLLALDSLYNSVGDELHADENKEFDREAASDTDSARDALFSAECDDLIAIRLEL